MSKEQQKDSIICVVCHQPTDPELDELVMAGFDEHGKAFAEKAHVHCGLFGYPKPEGDEMVAVKIVEGPVPSPMFACRNEVCAEEMVHPPEELRWLETAPGGDEAGWYCSACAKLVDGLVGEGRRLSEVIHE